MHRDRSERDAAAEARRGHDGDDASSNEEADAGRWVDHRDLDGRQDRRHQAHLDRQGHHRDEARRNRRDEDRHLVEARSLLNGVHPGERPQGVTRGATLVQEAAELAYPTMTLVDPEVAVLDDRLQLVAGLAYSCRPPLDPLELVAALPGVARLPARGSR